MEAQIAKQPLIIRESKLKDEQADYIVYVNEDTMHHQNIRDADSHFNPGVKSYPHLNLNQVPETNKISTSKYTWINCIPKIIFEQFSKMANLYFLIIAIMQSIDEISISNGKPVILLPLTVVVTINGIKDFMEDWKRKKSDDEENMRECQIYNKEANSFEKKRWGDIQLGNIIKVVENEYFPSDLVLINSSEPEGIAYVETKNLDGETNLKFKQANPGIAGKIKSDFDLQILSGKLECKKPNEFIYEFDGKFIIDKGLHDSHNLSSSFNRKQNQEEVVYVEKSSFLLRGCSLRQTQYVYGFVVYVGHNTKIMKNSPNAKTKTSRIEKIMNFQIILIFILQTVLASTGAIFYIIWANKFKSQLESYIPSTTSTGMLYFFYRVGTWTLIFTNLVPISLLVTLEMVKYVQGMFISWDISIYDRDTGTPAKVQTSTLNEELGQVKFIFSDKTGTLTKNYMEFRKMSIGRYSYGLDNPAPIEKKDSKGIITNFHLYDPEFEAHLYQEEPKHENFQNIHNFLVCLATCHTVITDSKEVNNIVYQSSSPDEMALVNAARYFKYFFTGRDMDNNIYLEIKGKQQTYQLLNLLEYSSERKRMSVIVKCPDNKIRLFIKGADTIIRERVTQNQDLIRDCDNHLLNFAQKGLRTLMIAYKEIPLRDYEDWSDEYRAAMNNPLDKDRLLPPVFDKIEKELYLLGSTAIEDQLQDNVDEVLSSFIETGIKVWVLTGDKTDTAKSIAFSSKLITHEFNIFEFKDKSSTSEIREQIIEFMKKVLGDHKSGESATIIDVQNILENKLEIEANNEGSQSKYSNKKTKKYALVVALDELTRIMKNEEITEMFYQLAIRCNSVLCCRVTPKQKAQMVHLVKDRQPNITTLAIGDGANDVNMITSANIGIGILGVEGRQAARASDYSIAQFQYLKRLLFVHGRESYRKNSYVVCYNFYKNTLFVMPQFWFGIMSYFSGQTLYDPWIYQLYNILFTCFPIIWFGIYDKEVSYDTLMADTRYYVQGIVGKLFHSARFWKWVTHGIIQGLFIYLFSYLGNKGPINSTGFQQDLFSAGSISYSAIVLMVNIKILVSTCTHSVISFGLFAFSVLMYYFTLYVMSGYYKFENFNNFEMNFSSPSFYLSTLNLVIVCLMIDNGINRILLISGVMDNPLELNAEEYEPKLTEMEIKNTLIEEEPPVEINNKYLGSAFSHEGGQAPQISKNL